jgi:hypothetical protein
MAIKYAKWTENWQNGHNIYQHLPLLDPWGFTQIGIFGLKRNHLASLDSDQASKKDRFFHLSAAIRVTRRAWEKDRPKCSPVHFVAANGA